MRVIAGRNRGIRLQGPGQEDVRPMLDRVKEALFSAIQFEIPGARVLDIFAGTGSLGLEALSRGAISAVFIEDNPRAVSILRHNIGLTRSDDQAIIEAVSIFDLLARQPEAHSEFDIIFLDPPYAMSDNRKKALFDKIMELKMLSTGGVMILHQEKGRDLLVPAGLEVRRDKCYGTSRMIIFDITEDGP